MMTNLDLENLDLEPHDREVNISISSRKLKMVSRRSVPLCNFPQVATVLHSAPNNFNLILSKDLIPLQLILLIIEH